MTGVLQDRESGLAGLANVAAMTFLAARAVPGGFVVALAAGVPLARAAERNGARAGYATAGASLVETVAVMGPARIGIPVPHAASAPALGSLESRGAPLLAMALAGAAIRFGYYIVTSAFYILVLVGLDAYTGTYAAIRETLGFLPRGNGAALAVTAAFLAVWSLGAGLIQAWVIRRGLRRWSNAQPEFGERPAAAPDRGGRVDPRAATAAGLVAIVVALASTEPLTLALVALWLAAAWLIAGAGARTFLGGLALAAPLALATLAFGLTGGLGTEIALRRALRVALLVLTAVWLRSAAGADGLREARCERYAGSGAYRRWRSRPRCSAPPPGSGATATRPAASAAECVPPASARVRCLGRRSPGSRLRRSGCRGQPRGSRRPPIGRGPRAPSL